MELYVSLRSFDFLCCSCVIVNEIEMVLEEENGFKCNINGILMLIMWYCFILVY